VNTEITLNTGLGLRHVIEDGIAILRGTAFAPARRAYVLDDLLDLFSKVIRGHELVQSPALFTGSAERGAFEAFSLLDRFLPNANDLSVQESLRLSANAFAQIKNGKTIPPEQRDNLSEFLRQILARLERQDSAGLRNEPEQIAIGL
jgi:hypothetical protein